MRTRIALSLLVLMTTWLPLVAKDKAAGDDRKTLHERSVYVPYEKLWKTFEKEGRGVFLPYDQFLELWRTAAEKTPRPPDRKPPTDSLVTEVSGTIEVAKDVIRVKSAVTIELLKEGWHEVPIRLDDVAITKALIKGNPARLLRKAQGYVLLLEKTQDAAEIVKLDLEFSKSFQKTPGRNSVRFHSPLAPISRWDVRIPEPGVKIDIYPLLAATEAPTEAAAEETRVLAFVGATPEVRIEWTPKAEGAKGLQALAKVKSTHEVWINEGISRNRIELLYDISRTELSQLEVEVPIGHKVINVFDPNVREWSVKQEGNIQKIAVALFEPTKGMQKLVVEMERFADEQEVKVPLIKALGVIRQQGIVAVQIGSGLRAEAGSREGLLQLDAGELPPGLAGKKWGFSYRYAALPFSLIMNVEKVQPRITADSFAEIRVRPEALAFDLSVLYDIRKAGVFQLELNIPGGFEVEQVQGLRHGNTRPVKVDRHHLEDVDADTRRLQVDLSAKALGRVGLRVRLERTLQEPDLLTPTGKTVEMPVAVPRVRGKHVEREQGKLVVYGPESLRINPVKQDGLRPIPHAEALAEMPAGKRSPGERPVLAFGYGDEAISLRLAAERRAPHVTARQLLVARIESGVVKYETTFFYDILYSGVKSLRIDVPAAKAGRIRVVTPDIRRVTLAGDDAPPDVPAGHVAWRLEGETEFMGSRRFSLRWEEEIEKLDIGKTVLLHVPRLMPSGIDRAWGQIVLTKAEAIDVTPAEEREGLRPVDPRQDLMAGANVQDAARAFEFHDAWMLDIKATRYEAQDVKATSIDRGLVRMVVTRSDVTSVQALYRMRSARQRLAIRLPGEVSFDTQPLRINGRPVPLERGEGGDFFVPLVSQNQDESFLLELRYVVSGGGLALQGPVFPKEPAIQQVYLSVFLPDEMVYLGRRGPWNAEIVWRLNGFAAKPIARRDRTNAWLLKWVARNLGLDRDSLDNFATDGQHLLFSTLRPVPGPEGALRIAAMREWVLQTILIILIIGLGVALLAVSLGRRLVIVGLAIVVVVLLAVFTPSFARAIVNNGTIAAGFIVFIIWVLWHLLVTLPRSPEWQARREARAEARRARRDALPAQGAAPRAAVEKGPPSPPVAEKANDPGAKGGKDDA